MGEVEENGEKFSAQALLPFTVSIEISGIILLGLFYTLFGIFSFSFYLSFSCRFNVLIIMWHRDFLF